MKHVNDDVLLCVLYALSAAMDWFFVYVWQSNFENVVACYFCICDFYIFVTLCFVLFVSGCGTFVCVYVFCTRFGIVGIVF